METGWKPVLRAGMTPRGVPTNLVFEAGEDLRHAGAGGGGPADRLAEGVL